MEALAVIVQKAAEKANSLYDDGARYGPPCNHRTEPRQKCLRELSWQHEPLYFSARQVLCPRFQYAKVPQLVAHVTFSEASHSRNKRSLKHPSGSVMTVSGSP